MRHVPVVPPLIRRKADLVPPLPFLELENSGLAPSVAIESLALAKGLVVSVIENSHLGVRVLPRRVLSCLVGHEGRGGLPKVRGTLAHSRGRVHELLVHIVLDRLLWLDAQALAVALLRRGTEGALARHLARIGAGRLDVVNHGLPRPKLCVVNGGHPQGAIALFGRSAPDALNDLLHVDWNGELVVPEEEVVAREVCVRSRRLRPVAVFLVIVHGWLAVFFHGQQGVAFLAAEVPQLDHQVKLLVLVSLEVPLNSVNQGRRAERGLEVVVVPVALLETVGLVQVRGVVQAGAGHRAVTELVDVGVVPSFRDAVVVMAQDALEGERQRQRSEESLPRIHHLVSLTKRSIGFSGHGSSAFFHAPLSSPVQRRPKFAGSISRGVVPVLLLLSLSPSSLSSSDCYFPSSFRGSSTRRVTPGKR